MVAPRRFMSCPARAALDAASTIFRTPPASARLGHMSMPTADIDTIRLWCREQVPQASWETWRVEPLVTGRHIDLFDVRIGRDGVEIRTPMVRLRYLNTHRWQLYWRDSDGTYNVYRNHPASIEVTELLEFLARDPDPLFWPDLPPAG